MTSRGWTQWVAIGVVVLMGVGSLGLVSLVGHAAPTLATHPAPSSPAAPAPASAPPATAAPAAIQTNAASAAAARALAVSKADGISPNDVFVPRPSADAAQVKAANSEGYVTPLYTATPAPIGLGEFGLAQDPSTGDVTPFILNTTSVQATFDPAAVDGPNATDLADSSPDGYGVQLNSVVTDVTLFGNDNYQFWTQNVVEYYPYAGLIYLITNVWNFSSPASYLSDNVFYAHGPLGTQVGNEYYYAFAGPFLISYPFNMTFTMTSTITDGRDAVYFSLNATTGNGSMDINATNYDYVIFNSLASDTAPLTVPANYTADGFHYNPLGLTNDFELTIGGPGGGSQTTFLTADAQETLSYWDATSGAYQAVPSAYSYGAETGETSVGASMSWTTGANGQPIGLMTTGASLLNGLWNASAPAGGPSTLHLNISPGNAFVFVSFAAGSSSAFNITEPEWAATVYTSDLTLPAGTYDITLELSGYVPLTFSNVPLVPGGSRSLTVGLAHSLILGVYTPLWAWSNAQVAALATSGSGTQGSPYVLINSQPSELARSFGVLNDYGFPVFPGVYFIGTTAYTEFNSPPSFAVNTSDLGTGPNAYPASNNLPYWFYDTSNIAIINAVDITGWFSVYAYDYPYFLTFNVEFWNSTNMLIANDTFNTQAQALLLYNGYSAANPLAAGDATIWGNTFFQTEPSQPSTILVPFADGLGISEEENFDVIYNNDFATPTTAVSYPTDFYYGYITFYIDLWNITPVASSVVNFDSNWPAFPLTGSIIGGDTQGGNFWWDYGLATSPYAFLGYFANSNPYGVLPYTESGWIDYFDLFGIITGDFAPLLYTPLQSLTIGVTGVAAGTTWNYSITSLLSPELVYWSGSANTSTVPLVLGNGTYQLNASADGYTSAGTTFTVSGTTSVSLTLALTYAATFTETGLPSGTTWSATVDGVSQSSTTPTITFALANGSYIFTVAPLLGYAPNPSSGGVSIDGLPVGVDVAFTPAEYTVLVIPVPGSGNLVTSVVTFYVFVLSTGALPSGVATLYLGPNAETSSAALSLSIVQGAGAIAAIPGLVLPVGATSVTYWATFSGESSSPTQLAFAAVVAPSSLTLSVITLPDSYSAFTVGSDGSGVAVTLSAHSATGQLLAVYVVGLGTDGSGSITLNSGAFASGTVWVATYGAVISNTVTTG